MKQINGRAYNIEADILGRITLKGKSIFNRTDAILVKADAKGGADGNYTLTFTYDNNGVPTVTATATGGSGGGNDGGGNAGG